MPQFNSGIYAMSSLSHSAMCPVCGGDLPLSHGDCPSCRASADWLELIAALKFAQGHFEQWANDQLIDKPSLRLIGNACRERVEKFCAMAREGRPIPTDTGLAPRDRCWSCAGQLHEQGENCPADPRFAKYLQMRGKAPENR